MQEQEKHTRILIIEDEKTIRMELEGALQRAGYETAALCRFSNVASEALKETPDLILLDVNLPGINGLHICEQIRKVSQIPIIFVTGNNTAWTSWTVFCGAGMIMYPSPTSFLY